MRAVRAAMLCLVACATAPVVPPPPVYVKVPPAPVVAVRVPTPAPAPPPRPTAPEPSELEKMRCQSVVRHEMPEAVVCIRQCPEEYTESPCGGGAVCGSTRPEAECTADCMSLRSTGFRHCFEVLQGSW